MSHPEEDPSGLDAHTPGAKLDAGKQLPYTVLGKFSPALFEVVRVGTFGANKYSQHGWLQVVNAQERYYEALLRHLLADMAHLNSKDDQTGIPHIAHAAWNILAILTLRVTEESNHHV